MAIYRKKPVEVEVVRLENSDQSIINAVEFIYKIGMETSIIGTTATLQEVRQKGGIEIETLEGTMLASFGDYIIKGVNGEFYPCKPDIFEKTYDLVQVEE